MQASSGKAADDSIDVDAMDLDDDGLEQTYSEENSLAGSDDDECNQDDSEAKLEVYEDMDIDDNIVVSSKAFALPSQ